MDYERVFSIVGLLAMAGWIVLIVSPLIPKWSDRIAGLIVPVLLSLAYAAIVVFYPAESGGFGSLAEVGQLFSNPQALLAGWIHFLAFDLLIGAWMCRVGRQEGIKFWLVLPCLPVTFLFGPAGFILFSGVRSTSRFMRRSE